MSIAEIMALLAENWIPGVSVCIAVCVIIYLVFSIRLVVTARRVDMNVGVTAMIPVWNLVLWLRKCWRNHKLNKPIKEDEEIEL